MPAILRYPIYLVASQEGIVVLKTDGTDCILLFPSKEIAQQQIAKIQQSHPLLGSLHALAIPNSQVMNEGLQGLSGGITCAIWDPAGTPGGFILEDA